MIFTEKEISELRVMIAEILTPKRFLHTVGVEDAAVKIAGNCLPEFVDEIRVAALLHDVSKEKSSAELYNSITNLDYDFNVSYDDLSTPATWHSLDAVQTINHSFKKFAVSNVLSAVRNHTVGAEDMSLFDEIIFVADYVEYGRTYSDCISARNKLFSAFEKCDTKKECIQCLHEVTIDILNNTIKFVLERNLFLHTATVKARNSLIKRTSTAE